MTNVYKSEKRIVFGPILLTHATCDFPSMLTADRLASKPKMHELDAQAWITVADCTTVGRKRARQDSTSTVAALPLCYCPGTVSASRRPGSIHVSITRQQPSGTAAEKRCWISCARRNCAAVSCSFPKKKPVGEGKSYL